MTNIPEVLRQRMIECPACHGELGWYDSSREWEECTCDDGKVPEPTEVWAERLVRVALWLAAGNDAGDGCYRIIREGDCVWRCGKEMNSEGCINDRIEAALLSIEGEGMKDEC